MQSRGLSCSPTREASHRSAPTMFTNPSAAHSPELASHCHASKLRGLPKTPIMVLTVIHCMIKSQACSPANVQSACATYVGLGCLELMQTRSSSCDALYDTARCTRDRYRTVPADSCEDFPQPCALGLAGLAVASLFDGLLACG